MKKNSIDTNNQLKLYHYGMRYMQLSTMYRVNGNLELSQKYFEKFTTLCDYLQYNIGNIPELNDELILSTIDKCNESRMLVNNEYSSVIRSQDEDSINSLKNSASVIEKSCQVLSKCLENHYLPPQLEKKEFGVLSRVIDGEIPLTDIKITIKKIFGNIDEDHTFKVRFYSISSDTPPLESPILPFGDNNYSISWNFLKRNSVNILKRWCEKRNLGFELEMYKKSFFKTTKILAGQLKVPLSLFASKSVIEQDFNLSLLPECPPQANLVMKILFQLHSPLLVPSTIIKKIPFYKIAQGSQIVKPPPPKQLNNEPKKLDNESIKITNKKLPEEKKFKKMEELTREELILLNQTLQKEFNGPFRMLEQEEIDRWMSNQLLKSLINQSTKAIQIFNSLNISEPPKLNNQLENLKLKFNENSNNLKSQKLTIPNYIKKIYLQINNDKKFALSKGESTPLGKAILERCKIMELEYQSLNKK